MSNFGNQIVSPSSQSRLGPYPFFTPSQSVDMQPSFMPYWQKNSSLKKTLNKLEDQVSSRRNQDRERQLMNRVSSLNQLIGVRQQRQEPDKTEMILQAMTRQQDAMIEMFRSMQGKQQQQEKKSKKKDGMHPIQKRYNQVTQNADEYEKLMKELDLEEPYEMEVYDPFLTDERKAQLLGYRKKPKDGFKQLKPISKFRAVAYAVLFPLFLLGSSIERKGRNKYSDAQTVLEQIRIFTEVGKAWALKATHQPLLSIVNDRQLDLNVLQNDRWWQNSKKDQNQYRLYRIQVRIKGILDGLIRNTNKNDFPGPLRLFLDRYTSNGTPLPQNYLLPFEKGRLDFDPFGYLRNQSEGRKQMQVALFFITKIIIDKFMLNPDKNGIPTKQNKNVQKNLKIIASILESIVLTQFIPVSRQPHEALSDEQALINRRPKEPISVRNDDKVSQQLPTIKEMETAYHQMSSFLIDMKDLLDQWTRQVLKLISGAKFRL